jgi:6-pyruvoyltetrahydropterin/6-carboxytetrahydropterin synthase
MRITIGKTFRFSAAHHLPNVPDDHQCRRNHGHNYTVTVVLAGELDEDQGWIYDYGEMAPVKHLLDWQYDHRDLNERHDNPTAELLAVVLADEVLNVLDLRDGVHLHSLTVRETDNTFATWHAL